jgi:hypothetical protein
MQNEATSTVTWTQTIKVANLGAIHIVFVQSLANFPFLKGKLCMP